MKWLFLILLLFNIVFFAYNYLFTEKLSEQTLKQTDDRKEIILLSEVTDKSELVLIKPGEQEKTTLRKEILETKTTDTDESTASEFDLTGSKSRTDERYSQNRLCYKLSPVTKTELDAIKLEIEKQFKQTISFDIEPTSETTYYRIYIPPLKSKKEIQEVVDRLDKNGLKDHYVMSIDGRKNAIALGVFKLKAAAEKVAKKAKRLGFATTIEAITDDKNSKYILQLEQDKLDENLGLEKKLIDMAVNFKKCGLP